MPESFIITSAESGIRLDHFLVRRYPDVSRNALAGLIRAGEIRINDHQVKAGYRLHENDCLAVSFPKKRSAVLLAQPIDFKILYEDIDLLVINKPPGLVVHPGDGNREGTLVNGLLYHCQTLPGSDPVRPGIVHRLDKDTSGIMLVAKTDIALKKLSDSFKNRQISKTYHAVLLREPSRKTGRLVAPIGRHPVHRKKMAIRHENGRYAATNWQVQQVWPGFSFVEIDLETGRTHQIRVHMASVGCPVAGDRLYGGRINANLGLSIERQLLHASSLRFPHPVTGELRTFSAPLPEDMRQVLSTLNQRNA